jgi:hypothetical protein
MGGNRAVQASTGVQVMLDFRFAAIAADGFPSAKTQFRLKAGVHHAR